MSNTITVLFTMKGCPFCDQFKNMLSESNIDFYEKDIDEDVEDYEMFKSIVESDYIPALMIVTNPDKDSDTVVEYFAPEKNYNTLDEALEIVKARL